MTATETSRSVRAKRRASAANGSAAKSGARSRSSGRPAAAKKTAAKTTRKTAAKAAKGASPSLFEPTGVTGKLARKTARKVATRALGSGPSMLRLAGEKAAATVMAAIGETTGRTRHRQLPIQRSIDIAVPLRVAWQEWTAFDFIPEGVHTVTDVGVDGGRLTGRIPGPREASWSAEILDARDEQSFAWQSDEGSDCAGLVTFHELSARLTRIELNLDVVPTSLTESFQLTTHLADHRADTDLRRFKARLELINPDLYEEDDTEESEEPEDERAAESGEQEQEPQD